MNYRLLVIFFLVFLISRSNSFAQTITDEDSVNYYKYSKITFSDPSYYALGGIGFKKQVRYEANFSPDILLYFNKSLDFGVEFNPQIILRSFNQFSEPIKTPSYMLKATFFYNIPQRGNNNLLIPFFTWGHHSNGQQGPFYNSDSTINRENGNFNTNYLMGGIMLMRPNINNFNLLSCAKLSANYNFLLDSALINIYGRTRFSADMESVFFLSGEKKNFYNHKIYKSKLTGYLQVTWLAGDLNYSKLIDAKRIIFSYSLYYQPVFLGDFSFFTRFYYGQDFYNINFDRTLTIFQFGLAIRNLYLGTN